MHPDKIRSTFIEFFVDREHRRIESSSLVPPDPDDPVLLVTSGMHPLIRTSSRCGGAVPDHRISRLDADNWWSNGPTGLYEPRLGYEAALRYWHAVDSVASTPSGS